MWIPRIRSLTRTVRFPRGQSLIQLFTFTNIFKLFLLSVFLPFGPKEANKDAIYKPEVKQHFTLEPVGYGNECSGPPHGAMKLPAVVNNGYYKKDKIALQEALEEIPVIRSFPKLIIQDSADATCEETSEHFSSNRTCQTIDTNTSTMTRDSEEMPASMKHRFLLRETSVSPLTIVLDLNLGTNPVSAVPFVRRAVTFLIGHAREKNEDFEVVVLLTSSGGVLEPYGLIASLLGRLRNEPKITLTIICDLKAVSGCYLVASVASPGRLFASPFAAVGSIGIILDAGLDLQEAFEKLGIKGIHVKSGERKSPGSALNGISPDEIQYLQDRSDRAHKAFKDHVKRLRSDTIVDFEMVSNGDYWLGQQALELGLVDKVTTSDEYLDEKIRNGSRILKLKAFNKEDKANFLGKGGVLRSLLDCFAPRKDHTQPDAEVSDRSSRSSISQFFQIFLQAAFAE